MARTTHPDHPLGPFVRTISARSFVFFLGPALVVPLSAVVLSAGPGRAANPVLTPARAAAPVILTGAQLGAWSQLPATGLGNAYPSGAAESGDSLRSAHNGRLF